MTSVSEMKSATGPAKFYARGEVGSEVDFARTAAQPTYDPITSEIPPVPGLIRGRSENTQEAYNKIRL